MTPSARTVSLLLLLSLLVGCAGDPARRGTPVTAYPESFSSGAYADAEFPGPFRWWEDFRDPDLNAAVEEALAASPDAARAAAKLEQAQALAAAAGSALRPNLTAVLQAGADRQPGPSGSHTGEKVRLSVEAGYEIDLWQKLTARKDAALFEAEAAAEDMRSLHIGIAARTADLYYLAVEQRAQLGHIDRTVSSFADTLRRVEERYRSGIVPALDLYQARQNLAQAAARRPAVETVLAQAENGLAALLGRFPGTEMFGDLAVLPEAPAQWPAGVPATVISGRPDVKSALARIAAADASAAAAVAERFPSFNILAGFGHSHTSLVAGDATGIFWSFLAGLVQPVLDGGRREAEIDRTSAVYRERVEAYRGAVLQAFREVEDALASNAATERRIVLLEARVEAASASLRLSEDRYLQGLSSYLPVLTAQILLFDAESQLLSARRQLIADRVSLARALGGSWSEDIPDMTGAGGDGVGGSHEFQRDDKEKEER